MKLIMETFRRKVNEAPMAGVLPLNVGVATAAGAKEEEGRRVKAANDMFIKNLYDMPNEEQFIEIEKGDLAGLGPEGLMGLETMMNDVMDNLEKMDVMGDRIRAARGNAHAAFIVENDVMVYKESSEPYFNPEGNYGEATVNQRSKFMAEAKTAKFPPALWARILATALHGMGLSSSQGALFK